MQPSCWRLRFAGAGLPGAFVALIYGNLWFQAYMSNARVSLLSLIGMTLRQVNARVIVRPRSWPCRPASATIRQPASPRGRIEAHYLAGGNVPGVIRAIIAAHRADIDLDFDRAAAIDLAGRDVLEAVQTSVYPKVIDCPDADIEQEHAQRHRQERRRAQGPRAGHRPHQPEAIDWRGHRRNGHRPRRRRDHHLDRLVRQPPDRDGESGPHLQGGPRPRSRLRRRPSRSFRSTSPTSTSAKTSAPACKSTRPRPTPVSPGPGPKSGGRTPSPASRK